MGRELGLQGMTPIDLTVVEGDHCFRSTKLERRRVPLQLLSQESITQLSEHPQITSLLSTNLCLMNLMVYTC